MKIIKIKKITLDAPINVYDLTVEKNHNFFASESKIVCHNCSDYHHGANGLVGTIAKMAQTFAGSNNINLLMPNGQFGSRLDPQPGAGRYIFTEMSKNFRAMFKKEDDAILKFQYSDELQIEPEMYYPVLPMLLVNGASGTGTGFACEILSYNPEDIRAACLASLNGKKQKPLIPWYKDFKGKIYRNEKQTVMEGSYELVNSTTIRITELPIGVYQDDYKKHLNKLEDEGVIKGYVDSSTEDGFDFEVNIPRTTGYMDEETIMKTFKLIGRSTENFTCWGYDGKLKVFDTPNELIDYFVAYRLEKYEERRLKQIEILDEDLNWATEKLRFIRFYLKNSTEFSKKKKSELLELLETNKFVEVERLLQIRIYSLTHDEITKLEEEIKKIKEDIDFLKSTSNKEIFTKELKELKL